MNAQGKPIGKGPKTVVCYICGRSYGRSSIGIHIPQCQKLFLEVESKKPASERRALPEAPAVLEEKLASGQAISARDLEAINDESFNKYNEEALVPCQWCGRTFLPDSLKRHQNHCTQDKPSKSISANKKSDESRDPPASTFDSKQADKVKSPARGTPVSKERMAKAEIPQDVVQKEKLSMKSSTSNAPNPSTRSNSLSSGIIVLRAVLQDLRERGMTNAELLQIIKDELE